MQEVRGWSLLTLIFLVVHAVYLVNKYAFLLGNSPIKEVRHFMKLIRVVTAALLFFCLVLVSVPYLA